MSRLYRISNGQDDGTTSGNVLVAVVVESISVVRVVVMSVSVETSAISS
jgi:hypothetical protein